MKVVVIKDTDSIGFADVAEVQLYVEGRVEFHQNADGFIQIKKVKDERASD